MKNILHELRKWLGLSQGELASTLGISRSLLAMAKTGERNLDPQSTLLLLALHAHLKAAPENESRLQSEKNVLESLLSKAAQELRFLELQAVRNKRMEKFKEPFPEREFPLPVSVAAPLAAEETERIFQELQNKISLRIHRYSRAYEAQLLAELEVVRSRAVVSYLQARLGKTES